LGTGQARGNHVKSKGANVITDNGIAEFSWQEWQTDGSKTAKWHRAIL